MKLNNKHILCSVAAASLIAATACTDSLSPISPSENNASQEVVFHISASVKATDIPAYEIGDDFEIGIPDDLDFDFSHYLPEYHISDGTHTDVLVFAVYEKNDDGIYEISTEYQKFTDPVGNVTAGVGQNIINMSGRDWPYEVRLLLNPEKEYRVAFWAQNSECEAFNVSDFHQIRVNYSKIKNNYEGGDAFYEFKDVKGTATTHEVVLHRAFAQVNIGTAGWDYEGAAYLKPSPITYSHSKVKFSGAASRLDMFSGVADEVITDTIMLDYDVIPAFEHVKKTIQWDRLKYRPHTNEEFLFVNLDDQPEIDEYKSFTDFINFRNDPATEQDFTDGKRPPTETFKYLSMFYVLSPSVEMETTDSEGTTFKENVSKGTLPYLKFYARDKNGAQAMSEFFEILNVPIQRNWRTNILGNDIFTGNMQYRLYIVPTFCGSYNDLEHYDGNGQGNGWQHAYNDFNEANGWIWFGNRYPNLNQNPYDSPTGDPNDDPYGDFSYDGFNPEGPAQPGDDGFSAWPSDYYTTSYDIWCSWIGAAGGKITLYNNNGIWIAPKIHVPAPKNGQVNAFAMRCMYGPSIKWWITSTHSAEHTATIRNADHSEKTDDGSYETQWFPCGAFSANDSLDDAVQFEIEEGYYNFTLLINEDHYFLLVEPFKP